MNLRIKKWIEKEGLKSSQFADKIGVNRATISHILSGRNKPSVDFLEKLILSYPDLDANWLITGIGYMYKTKEQKDVKISKSISKVVILYNDMSFDQLNS